MSMTVKELIEKLSLFPDHEEVKVNFTFIGTDHLFEIQKVDGLTRPQIHIGAE